MGHVLAVQTFSEKEDIFRSFRHLLGFQGEIFPFQLIQRLHQLVPLCLQIFHCAVHLFRRDGKQSARFCGSQSSHSALWASHQAGKAGSLGERVGVKSLAVGVTIISSSVLINRLK